MDRSAYLAQALQSMGQPQPQPQAPQGLSLQQMQGIAQKRAAWEAQNPGQSYMEHGLQQMGQNLMNAPGALAAAPGNVASSFGKMIQGLPGFPGNGKAPQAQPKQYAGVPIPPTAG